MSKDLFAPPSKEEVEKAKLLAPPTEAELNTTMGRPKPSPTLVEKAGRAVVAGAKE